MRTRRAICGRAAQRLEAAAYGLANDKAFPMIFGEDIVAVLIPCECEEGERVSGEVGGRSTGHKSRRNTHNSPRSVARALGVRRRRLVERQRPLDQVASEDVGRRRVEELRAEAGR